MIQVEGVCKRFGSVVALEEVTFTVDPGQVLGLVGPNGAGKTTLFRILSTLARPTRGRAMVCGHDVSRSPRAARATVGVVFTEPALYGQLTPRELLYYFGHLHGLRGTVLSRRIRVLEELFDLAEVRGRLIDGLSRGMKQRVALARAVVHEPPVLLLDEPTTGLDFQSADRVIQFLTHYASGRCVVFATHNFQEIELVCHRVLILSRGRVVEETTVAPDAAKYLRQRVLQAMGE